LQVKRAPGGGRLAPLPRIGSATLVTAVLAMLGAAARTPQPAGRNPPLALALAKPDAPETKLVMEFLVWLDAYLDRVGILPFMPALLACSSALVGAWVAWGLDPGGARGLRGFLAYAFPRRVLLHPSARLDYLWAVAHKLTYPFLIAPALVAAAAVAHVAAIWTDRFLGPPVHAGPSWWAAFAATLVAGVLARDFAHFWWHRLEHRVWWLWEFHKVHHAAEAMVYGLTARRNHPLNEFVQTFLGALLVGAVAGLFARLVNADVDFMIWLGISLFYAFELLGLRHLKHSHINLRFPRWLEYVLVSPGQHQVHHSTDARHWNRNFSTLFAFWDVLYGSWHASEPKPVRIGLADGESLEYRSLRALYLLPFVKIGRGLRARFGRLGAAKPPAAPL
jgi:sterol desaturase/sphingolipid hydroxylase (fatty acid hydroxylase superfamily)